MFLWTDTAMRLRTRMGFSLALILSRSSLILATNLRQET